jgi:formate hydrogenlyase subunit 4
VTGETSLAGIQAALGGAAWGSAGGALALVCAALLGLLLAENARIPFDDPTTHLELTMIHEVMALDHGGFELAELELAAAAKLWLFASLLAGALVPLRSGADALDVAAHLAGIALVGALVGVIESTTARLRLLRVPQLLLGLGVLGFLAVLLAPGRGTPP